MPGVLVVCPTPIGNLDDVSARARDALVAADWIACEDTRRTGGLLDKLGIRPAPPLVSNHEGNEAARATELAQRIERGDTVVLVSDAGMPAISDPGYRLIRRCIDRALDVTVLPGPSVVPVALVASGLPTDRWRFEGFLPKRSGEMERVLRSALRQDPDIILIGEMRDQETAQIGSSRPSQTECWRSGTTSAAASRLRSPT